MIVPISQGGGDSGAFAAISQSGGTDPTNQLMALSNLEYAGKLQPQSAQQAPQSHKSIREQLKGKVA